MNNKSENKVDNKIIFIGPIKDRGGIGSVIKLYQDHFKDSKYISTYPGNETKNKIIEFITSILRIVNELHTDPRIKILHIHCASKGSFYRKSIIVLIGKLLKRKIIMHMHGGGFKSFYNTSFLNELYIKHILRFTNKVICLSEEWKTFYSTEIGLKNTVVIENAVESGGFFSQGRIDGKIKLLFMGKICDQKGIFELINYLKSNKYFNAGKIQLTICGTGEEKRLKEIINNISSDHSIDYVGWIEGIRKKELIKDSTIYILPSHYEGVPISILECMAWGKPIIATNVGGIPSVVTDEYNGWLIEPRKLGKLDEIFDQIFQNPQLIKVYGENSYKRMAMIKPEKMFKKIEKVYQELNIN